MSDKDELKFTYGMDRGWWVKLWHKNRVIASVLGLSFDCARENAQKLCRRWNSQPDLLAACETAEVELEQRYKAQEGSPVDKVALKIVKTAIAKAQSKQ